LYSNETIDDFIIAFPTLTTPIKGLFIDYFKEKYHKTNDEKFLRLNQLT